MGCRWKLLWWQVAAARRFVFYLRSEIGFPKNAPSFSDEYLNPA
jgi:hypothetical protein